MGRAWVKRAAAAASSLGLGGCLVVNGAFDPGQGGASEGSSGAVSTGGSGETGTGTSTGTSSGSSGSASEGTSSDATSSAPTSGETTTGESTTAATVTDTSGTTGTTDTTSMTDMTGTTGMTTEGESSTGIDACAGDEGDMCTSQQIAGQTYLICERTETWGQARKTCKARCARLVILDEAESAEVYAALRLQMTAEDIKQEQDGGDQIVMPRASWWLGGRKVDGEYLWLDGTPMPPKGTGGWYSNDPDIGGDDACAVLGVFGKGDANGKWFDRSCKDVLHRSICEPL